MAIPFSSEPDCIKAGMEVERHMAGLDPELTGVLDCLAVDPDAKLSDVASETGMSLSSVKRWCPLKPEGMLRNGETNRSSRWVLL